MILLLMEIKLEALQDLKDFIRYFNLYLIWAKQFSAQKFATFLVYKIIEMMAAIK